MFDPAEPVMHNGEKFRACVAAVVFNEKGEVLVGERVGQEGKEGSWQFPQGGVDEGETLEQAAARELYEEMGLKLEPCFSAPRSDDSLYSVDGGWLKQNGFAGQHLGFTAFHAPSSILAKIDLSGLGGEKPEFSSAKWTKFSSTPTTVFPPKRTPYLFAVANLMPRISNYISQRY